jgi:hypothetical protein
MLLTYQTGYIVAGVSLEEIPKKEIHVWIWVRISEDLFEGLYISSPSGNKNWLFIGRWGGQYGS